MFSSFNKETVFSVAASVQVWLLLTFFINSCGFYSRAASGQENTARKSVLAVNSSS